MAAFQNYTLGTFNATLLNDTSLCTLQTCPLVLDGVPLAHFTYLPSLAGNALYAAIFGLLIALQFVFGIKYRTIGYLIGMGCGLLLEIVGYIARIQMHSNPFTKSSFIMYLCCLTIAPAFLTAAVYLCLSRIVIICSEEEARFQPKTYTFFFIFCDFVSLLLQGAGGGIASTATTVSMDNLGKNMMIAGLVWQVVSLGIFGCACLDLYLRYHKASALNGSFTMLRNALKFRLFLFSLLAASVFIFVRSVFRCAELSQGFHGKLANQQITFMVLDGVMIILATSLLTAFHPGLVMGRETWAAADWSAGRRKRAARSGGKWWTRKAEGHGVAEKVADPETSSTETMPGPQYEYTAQPVTRV